MVDWQYFLCILTLSVCLYVHDGVLTDHWIIPFSPLGGLDCQWPGPCSSTGSVLLLYITCRSPWFPLITRHEPHSLCSNTLAGSVSAAAWTLRSICGSFFNLNTYSLWVPAPVVLFLSLSDTSLCNMLLSQVSFQPFEEFSQAFRWPGRNGSVSLCRSAHWVCEPWNDHGVAIYLFINWFMHICKHSCRCVLARCCSIWTDRQQHLLLWRRDVSVSPLVRAPRYRMCLSNIKTSRWVGDNDRNVHFICWNDECESVNCLHYLFMAGQGQCETHPP